MRDDHDEERYRFIIDTIPQIVWTATPDGVQDYANLRWYEFNGVTPGAADPEPWRGVIHPDDVELTARTWAHSLRTGEPYTCLHRNRRHDGEFRWVLSRAVAQRDEHGRILRWIGSGTDITDQKRAEAELVTYRDHLEELVRERTAELTLAKERAEVASQAKSEFVSSMSHELRTPLNAILGYAQILERSDNLTETQLRQLQILHGSGAHLLALIDDILDVGRIEAGRLRLEEAAFELPAALRQVFDLTRVKAAEKELTFRYEPLGELPACVRGDERILKQILLNLLSNAIKYTPRGGVVLRVRHDQAGPGTCRCEIADSGVGIPRDQLEAIFEPFTQLAGSGERRDGAGLGLTITRKLVTLMHGTLGVESEPGVGSTFWVEVPLPVAAAGELAPGKDERSVAGYRGERRRVLVVDDNVTNAAMLVSLLEPLGFEVLTAEDGRDAVRQALAWRPHLVLMDLAMPGLDGLEATRELRRHPELAGTRIVGVSATISDSARKEAFVAACDRFLGKPIEVDALLEVIQAQLGIEWELRPRARPAAPSKAPDGPADLGTLSAEELAEVHALARLGNMQGIQDWATSLEARDPRHGPIARSLRALAREFKPNAILALLEQRTGREG